LGAGGGPLFVIDFERPEGFLTTAAERDDLAGRIEAAIALGRGGTTAAQRRWEAAFDREQDVDGAHQIAAALARNRTPEARARSPRDLRNSVARTRLAVAQALGAFRHADAHTALESWLAMERHPLRPRGTCCDRLGASRAPGALARLTGRARRDRLVE